MALTTCPDCQGPLSDMAPMCPRCGWSRAVVQATAAAEMAAAHKAASRADGQRLVTKSNWLAFIGLLLIVLAWVNHITSFSGLLYLAGPGGLVLLVVAAVIGQIGRAKQGRVI